MRLRISACAFAFVAAILLTAVPGCGEGELKEGIPADAIGKAPPPMAGMEGMQKQMEGTKGKAKKK